MTNEMKTHSLFLTTNDFTDLNLFKRGILPEDDEYKRRPREIEEDEH